MLVVAQKRQMHGQGGLVQDRAAESFHAPAASVARIRSVTSRQRRFGGLPVHRG